MLRWLRAINANLRRAARSSGDALFLTSCTILRAVFMSTPWDCVMRETFDPNKADNLPVGSRPFCEVTELERDRLESRTCTCVASSSRLSSALEPNPQLNSVRSGELTMLFCFRLATVKSANLEVTETGEPFLGVPLGELVLVFGLERRLWLPPLL